jgi:hypothetical protein
MQRSVPCPSSPGVRPRGNAAVSVNFVNFRFRSGQSGNQPAQDRDARFEVVDAVPWRPTEGDRPRSPRSRTSRDDETGRVDFVLSIGEFGLSGRSMASLFEKRPYGRFEPCGWLGSYAFTTGSSPPGLWFTGPRDTSPKTEDRWPPPYRLRSPRDRDAAARRAVRALRLCGRPQSAGAARAAYRRRASAEAASRSQEPLIVSLVPDADNANQAAKSPQKPREVQVP